MLSVDVEKSAGRGDTALLAGREALVRAVQSAAELAGLEWAECTVSRHGDMLRLIAPPGTDKARLIHPLMQELSHELRAYNRRVGPGHEVRVRAAVHAGEVFVDDGEVVGHPLELLARMLDADPLKEALADAPRPVTVAMLVSDHVYDDTVRQGHRGIDPESFSPVRFTVKETTATAWLRVTGVMARALAGAPEAGEAAEGGDNGGIHQTARDRARVGQMIGNQLNHSGSWVGRVGGNAAVGPGGQVVSTVILDGLTELRRLLRDHCRLGDLDEGTYAEADEELRTAEDEAAAPSDARHSRLVLALKKLQGLVSDVSDLGTRVAALITAVRAL